MVEKLINFINRINKLHERALRLIYNDYESTIENLLTNDGSFTVHHLLFKHLL